MSMEEPEMNMEEPGMNMPGAVRPQGGADHSGLACSAV